MRGEFLFFVKRPEKRHGFLRVFLGVERRKPEKSFAFFAESHAGSSDYADAFQKIVEKLPGIVTLLAFEPDIGRVLAARMPYAQLGESIGYYFCVLFIVSYGLSCLPVTFGSEYLLGPALYDV